MIKLSMGETERRYCRTSSDTFDADWQNPTLIGRNKLPGRFHEIPHPGVASAMGASPSPNQVALDGDWRFHWSSAPRFSPGAWFDIDFDDSDWSTIPVPGNWELSGFGRAQYTNIVYPYSHDTKNPPAINPDDNPTGRYRLSFSPPDDWFGRPGRIILRFDGIRSAAQIWVNGNEVGYTQNSYSPAEYDITEQLSPGDNNLSVEVYKWCAGTYLEDQDIWRLAGIIRSVSLIFIPSGGLFDVFARCRFDGSFRHAQMELECTFDPPPVDTRRFLRWYLYEPGHPDVFASSEPVQVELSASKSGVVYTKVFISHPHLWSSDDPFLYNLIVEVTDEESKAVDVRSMAWGFRQIDVEQGFDGPEFRVNGQAVKLRGVNRHDFHPRHGQALPRELIESDLLLLKRFNVNAVRCSHYPNPEAFYEIADRIGLYVIDEANLESHGLRSHLPGSRPEWEANCIDRACRMVLNHRNHPSIIIWSLGHEAGHGGNIRRMKEALVDLDTTRPVHYEGDHLLDTSDLFSLMHPTLSTVNRVGRRRDVRVAVGEEGRPRGWRVSSRQYRDKPFLLCGFSQAMGKNFASFTEYMRIIEERPNIAGGFIWDFADLALYKTDDEGTEYLAYGGESGEQPHDGILWANGVFSSERRSQPGAAEMKALYAPVAIRPVDMLTGSVTIVNRHSHIDLSIYELHWALERDGIPVAEGIVRRPDIRPGEERQLSLYRNLAAFPGGGEGFVTFSLRLCEGNTWAPVGHEVARIQLPVPKIRNTPPPADAIFEHLSPILPKAEVDASSKSFEGRKGQDDASWRCEVVGESLVVAGAAVGARIRLANGALETLDFGSGNVLTQSLEPDFFRAPRGSERGGLVTWFNAFFPEARGMKKALERIGLLADRICGTKWESAARKRRAGNLAAYRLRRREEGLEIRFALKANGFFGRLLQTMVFRNDGSVSFRMAGRPHRSLIRFGTRMGLNSLYRRVKWYGYGPQESYVDRRAGTLVGLYTMDAGELAHDYLMPQESGNRSGVRWVAFSDGGSSITFDAPQGATIDFSARFASAGHAHEIVPSDTLHVHIDAEQPGLGGSLPAYKMKAFRRRSLEYSISRKT